MVNGSVKLEAPMKSRSGWPIKANHRHYLSVACQNGKPRSLSFFFLFFFLIFPFKFSFSLSHFHILFLFFLGGGVSLKKKKCFYVQIFPPASIPDSVSSFFNVVVVGELLRKYLCKFMQMNWDLFF